LEAREVIFLFVFLLSALLDVAFFFPIVRNAFFKAAPEEAFRCEEAPLIMVIPLTATGLFSLVLGIYPDALIRLFSITQQAVRAVLSGG
jgi:multicomponent Na+:H+ antiporter subunit D